MHPFCDFSADVEWVLETCKKRVATYPAALRHHGLANVNKFRGRRNFLDCAYYLPFWLQDAFELDQNTCRLIALGNAFGQHYFLVQDEVMDADPEEYKGHLLPLGNLFFLDFIATYRSFFDSRSPFWEF
jgi:hypothetical protein